MRTAIPLLAAVGVLLSVPAISADPSPGAPTAQAAPSKETREKMAVLHEQMAACLRSDKDISTCHTEMRKNCHDTLGAEGCPMMGKGHGHMMQTTPAPSSPK